MIWFKVTVHWGHSVYSFVNNVEVNVDEFDLYKKVICKRCTVEVGSLHRLRLESLKLVFQPLHKFHVDKL
jgi:hypothetical protein